MGKQRGKRRSSRRAILRRLAGNEPIGTVRVKPRRKVSRVRTVVRRVLIAGSLLGVMAIFAGFSPRIARASGGGWLKPFVDINAPEIDPGSLSSALTLLVGGCLMLKKQVRRD